MSVKFAENNASGGSPRAAPGGISVGMASRGGSQKPMSFQEAAEQFKIEDNARGFVEATVMPYLTAGFEELLNVAKERGELRVAGEDGGEGSGGGASSGDGEGGGNAGKEAEQAPAPADDENSDDEEMGDKKFNPLRWLSDYLRQYVETPGKYKELFAERFAKKQADTEEQ